MLAVTSAVLQGRGLGQWGVSVNWCSQVFVEYKETITSTVKLKPYGFATLLTLHCSKEHVCVRKEVFFNCQNEGAGVL